MTRSYRAWKERDIHRGSSMVDTKRKGKRMRTRTKTPSWTYNLSARADAERYRRYHDAKAKIQMDLPAAEYEERVKKLARKYHI